MRSPVLICLLFLCSNLLIAQTSLSQQEALRFKETVSQNASEIETISSDFMQIKHLDFLENDTETVGEMAFKNPNMLKWEYTSPNPYSIIFKDHQLHINNNGSRSKIDLTGNNFLQSLNDLMVKSIKGDLFNEEEFDIQYFRVNDKYMAEFQPKLSEINTFIETFQLTFDRNMTHVIEVKMIEPSGDYTQIIFQNPKINTVLDEAVFKTEN